MFGSIIIGVWGSSIVTHFITTKYKKSKLKKKIMNELENLGYDVNKNLINEIFKIMCMEIPEYYDEQLVVFAFSLVPFLNLTVLYFDITYLLGNHINEPYWDNFSINKESRIEYLLSTGVISENKEKMQFIEDKNNALKELENKYKDIKVPKDNSIIMISKNDSEKELYEKLEQLQEMILIKHNETSNNDVKNLEYKNKEGNIYEKI